MEKAILPTGKAHEPNEGARNPMAENMAPHQEHLSSRRLITFADDTEHSEKPAPQKSYKEVLSQPAPSLSHRQKLLWLQKRRTSGLWVQCDDCDRWRFLPNILDRHELANKWYCRMNPDSSNADCSVPETPIHLREEEDLIHSIYSAGSVVWARMPGWPWWPAMVDDCPDTEQFYWLDGFSDIPTHYNVVFFDASEVTRGWITPDNLKTYAANKNDFKVKEKKYKARLQSAIKQAEDASTLSLVERLAKHSFIAKYKGNLISPKKVTKKDLIKHQKKMKRRFNIEFPIETSDSEDGELLLKSPMKKRNMIILGTPKRDKTKRIQNLNVVDVDATAETTLDQNSTDIINTTPALPTNREMAKKRIQDIMDKGDTSLTKPVFKGKPKKRNLTTVALKGETKTGLTEPSTNDLKQPNSLAVQAGSTADTVPATESYDNDTSKTYVPEFERTLESTVNETEMGTQEFEARAATPNSDDFEF